MDYRRYVLERAKAGDAKTLSSIAFASYLHTLSTAGYLVVDPPSAPLRKEELITGGIFGTRALTRVGITPAGEALLATL